MKSKIIFLGFLLVIASFVAGLGTSRYFNKAQSEKVQSPKQEASPASITQQEPSQPRVLGAEDFAKILENPAATKGEKNAPVTIIEFSEYLCPFCAEYVGFDSIPSRPIDEEKTYQKIMDKYVGQDKVYYLFKDYPIHGQPAVTAAIAARCAGEQDKYWQYHDLLFERQNELASLEEEKLVEKLKSYAKSLKLDEKKFNSCLDEEKYLGKIEESYKSGMEAAKMAWDAGWIDKNIIPEREKASLGTPTFFINGQVLQGAYPFSEFEKIIEEELKK